MKELDQINNYASGLSLRVKSSIFSKKKSRNESPIVHEKLTENESAFKEKKSKYSLQELTLLNSKSRILKILNQESHPLKKEE